jgi:Fic family protein
VLDFLAIHPFHDGNGRAARLLSTYLLERSGYHVARFYPLDSVILENRDAYYEALFRAQQRWYQPDEDLTPWIELYTDMVFQQYLRAFQRVKDAHVRQR